MLISPFQIWQRFSRNIPVSTLVGCVFPLIVLLCYRGQFGAEMGLKLAWVSLGIATFQYSMLMESGERGQSGNWGWGMVFTDHVLFLASCEFLLRQRTDAKKAFCFLVFLLHVATGGFHVGLCLTDPKWAVFF